MSVLAEVHGKTDPESGAPVDRSEDLLTDAVFGTLRHIDPRLGLGPLLRDLGLSLGDRELGKVDVRFWPQIPMPRWPGKVIEPDVIVIAGGHVVVFEAKLYSPFSQYRDPDAPDDPALHQLAVQYAAVKDWAAGERLGAPTMVAVTADVSSPRDALRQARDDIYRLTGDVDPSVGWLSWHRLAALLEGQVGLQPHEMRHRQDLMDFMERRGVRRVFAPIPMEDYWLMAAAQRVAVDRLYPQIRTFFDELTSVLDDDDIGWSQPSYKGMWLGGSSTSVAKPADWSRSFVGAQYWPRSWPPRLKAGSLLSLYTVFDFLEPALEVGLSIPGPGVAVAQQAWIPLAAQAASALGELEDYEVAIDGGDLARPLRVIPCIEIDEAWLSAACGLMGTTAHLRLRNRLSVATLTVQEARVAVKQARDAASNVAPLWAALVASSQISSQGPSANRAATRQA